MCEESRKANGSRIVKFGCLNLKYSVSRGVKRQSDGPALGHMGWLKRVPEAEVVVCLVAWPLLALIAIQPGIWLADSIIRYWLAAGTGTG